MSRSVGIMETIRELLPEWAVAAFDVVSLFDDLLVIVPLLGLLYLADVRHSIERGDPDHPLCSDRTVFLIATVFGGLSCIVVLKATFAAPRPPVEFHAVQPSAFGFPSGHTMAATVFWGALATWTAIGRRRTRLAAAGLIVALVALSRLALGVHYLVDVVASIAFGTAYLYAMWVFVRGDAMRAFGVAIGLSVLAAVVTGGSSDGLLALVGTVGSFVGWVVSEQAAVRQRILALTSNRRVP